MNARILARVAMLVLASWPGLFLVGSALQDMTLAEYGWRLVEIMHDAAARGWWAIGFLLLLYALIFLWPVFAAWQLRQAMKEID